MSRKPKSPAGKCRDCQAPIYWAESPKGKMLPFDQAPDARGNAVLFKRPDGTLRAEYLGRGERAQSPTRRCHFDTCSARQHQQKGGGRQQQGRPAPAGAHGALVGIILCYADGTQLRMKPQSVSEVLPNRGADQRQAW